MGQPGIVKLTVHVDTETRVGSQTSVKKTCSVGSPHVNRLSERAVPMLSGREPSSHLACVNGTAAQSTCGLCFSLRRRMELDGAQRCVCLEPAASGGEA